MAERSEFPCEDVVSLLQRLAEVLAALLPTGQPEKRTVEFAADPLSVIPGARDRMIARLWRSRHTAAQIAAAIDRTEKTVREILSRLRKAYGTGVVPYKKDVPCLLGVDRDNPG